MLMLSTQQQQTSQSDLPQSLPNNTGSKSDKNWVEYKNEMGFIAFECETCVTICVREFPDEPSRNVNVVVYAHDFNDIIYLDHK